MSRCQNQFVELVCLAWSRKRPTFLRKSSSIGKAPPFLHFFDLQDLRGSAGQNHEHPSLCHPPPKDFGHHCRALQCQCTRAGRDSHHSTLTTAYSVLWRVVTRMSLSCCFEISSFATRHTMAAFSLPQPTPISRICAQTGRLPLSVCTLIKFT